MEVSARDIEQVEFHDAWRGYNQAEVDDFLDQVGATVERLMRENEALRARLQEIETTVESARATEEMMKKALLTAQQTAEQTLAEARSQADRLLEEATSGMDSRKHDVEASLASLQRFETETKQRLRSVLEEQLKTLDALAEHPAAMLDHAPAPTAIPDVVPSPTPAPVEEPVAAADSVSPDSVGPEIDGTPEIDVSAPEASTVVEESAAEEGTDTSLFDFDVDEDDEPPLDDFRPFDDEAALQSRRRRGLFRRKVDDWA